MWNKIEHRPGINIRRKNKMRIVPVTKLDVTMQDSRSYWENVIEKIEARVTKVKCPSYILLPSLSLAPVKCNASDSDNVDYNLVNSNTQMRNIVRDLIVRVSPPSPSHDERVSDINSRDLRHDEQMNYLKDCHVDNIKVDFLREENSRNSTVINEESEKKIKIKPVNNSTTIYETFSANNNPPLNKIANLSKISGYVNDFLSSTKVKIGSSVMPKKIKLSQQKPDNNFDEDQSNLFIDKIDNNGFSRVEDINGMKVEHQLDIESEELLKKHVGFQDTSGNSEDSECWGLRRTRAPTLGVASAVPSFGKILSSFENTDSIECSSLKDSASNDSKLNDYVQIPKDLPIVSKQKSVTVTERKNLLKVHDVKLNKNSTYPYLNRQNLKKYESVELFNEKNLELRKKSKIWTKRSITHVITALNHMKRRQKIKNKCDYEISSKLQTSSGIDTDHYLSDGHSELTIDVHNTEKPLTNSTSTSTSSCQSVRQRLIKNSIGHDEKIDLPCSTLIDEIKLKPSDILIQSTVNSHNNTIKNTLPTVKKISSGIILSKIPQINSMYPRIKYDKCLACLDISMKNFYKYPNDFLKYHQNIKSLSTNSEMNKINDDFDIFHRKILSELYSGLTSKFITNLNNLNYQNDFTDNNYFHGDTIPISDILSCTNSHTDDSINQSAVPSSTLDRKPDQAFDKTCIVSSQPFVSTLSLTSERSKTASDQDDSDQAIDEIGAMEDGIVESRSKFLAPCHTPLNLRPSLEPLKALCGKKTRSIQSRMTSLEKTADVSCDYESDDNEIPTAVGILNVDNKNKCLSSKKPENESNTSGDCKNTINKLQYEDECKILNEIPLNSSYQKLIKASTLANDIYSQLNVDTNLLEYDPSQSFRPTSPILSISEIIEISKNSLKNNNSIVETLQILMNEYMRQFSEKLKSKQNISNIKKVENTTKNLLALLVDSKHYLNPHFTSYNLNFSSQQKSINSRQLKKILPLKSYNLIAPILGIPQWHPKQWSTMKDTRKIKTTDRTVTTFTKDQKVLGLSKNEFITDFDLIVHPPSQKGSSLSKTSDNSHRKKLPNPYASFLAKPRRKVVIWRKLTERDLEGYDPEATLKNRASKITNTICSDFCQWLRSLGGFDTTVNEEVLKNMFETDFTAEACKTMQVSISEMPMIPTVLANIRNCPEAGELEIMRRQLRYDLKAEKKSTRLVGFGTALPHHLKFIPTKNHIEDSWIRCKNVPKDLETMETIWRDITHLDSVKGFTQWLKNHPNIKIPPALQRVSFSKNGKKYL